MLLTEVFEKQPEAYQDLSADNSQITTTDLRKTRLTLRQLNKLRQMTDVRNYEHRQKLEKIQQQYAPPVQPLA